MGSKYTKARDPLHLLANTQLVWWESSSEIIKSILLAIKSRSPWFFFFFMSWNYKWLPSPVNKQVNSLQEALCPLTWTQIHRHMSRVQGGSAAREAKDASIWKKELLAIFEEWQWQHQTGKFSASALWTRRDYYSYIVFCSLTVLENI